MNMPDLHIHISRENKDEWMKWATKLKEGKSFLASVLTKALPLEGLVNVYAPSGVDSDDPAVRHQAFKDPAKRLRDGWTDSTE